MPSMAYLSLGSNIGDREANLREGIARLEPEGRIVSVSSLYETEPVEFADQDWFLNSVVALETSDTAAQLLAAILQIETEMGRQRVQPKGPRIIDIDILLFEKVAGGEIVDSPALTIPHPSMHQRRFVLQPLAEIAPRLQHPVLKKTIQELLDALPAGQSVQKYQSN
jgi:2-amino-4-hydroxy-6-hydroxymethyldihydropteridine diphosphokinase